MSQRKFDEPDKTMEESANDIQENAERKVLSIAQDIINTYSNGRKKMPKHVGLGLTIRNLVHTCSKEITTMLNHHGHFVNYWECEQIHTSWAISVMKAYAEKDGYYKAVVQSNINPGQFI